MARQAVYDNFIRFTEPHEGYVPKMYIDQKGYVTTGYGNLIGSTPKNPLDGQITGEGLNLAWRRDSDNSLASRSEILEAFETVKNSGMANAGGGNQKHLTSIHLDRDDILTLVKRKLEQFENTLRSFFPAYDTWPADAQLGALSMAWAMGGGFPAKYPKFTRAANQLMPDFLTMAQESVIPELGMPDAKPEGRNAQQIKLFTNAAAVMQQNLDPDTLHWLEGALGDTAEFVARGAKPALGGAGVLLLLIGGGSAAYYLAKHKGLL